MLRLLIILFTFTGCINLKKLNSYSSSAVTALKKMDELEYSFGTACRERCEAEQLKKLVLKIDCNCKEDASADSVTNALYRLIKNYFEGLSKLSANGLTDYSYNGLAKGIREGNFGGISIDKKKADAAATIANLLTRAVTDAYRGRKLSGYIAEANEPIQALLEALHFILTADLSKKLEVRKERLESFYFDLVEDSSLSNYEKKLAITEYNHSLAATAARKKMISAFAGALHTIGKGHQEIFEKRNRLSAKEVMEMMSRYAGELREIADAFNSLQK